MGDIDHFKNLFAWGGLLYMLQTSRQEDFSTHKEDIQKMLLGIITEAKNYIGSNPQFIVGYQEVIESIPLLTSFYPDLPDLLDFQ